MARLCRRLKQQTNSCKSSQLREIMLVGYLGRVEENGRKCGGTHPERKRFYFLRDLPI
jgi:hypothetical protein